MQGKAKSFVQLLHGKDLSAREAEHLFELLFQEKLSDAEAKALLVLLAKKGETAAELEGCLKALRKHEPIRNASISHLMDTCGSGGDGSHSINLSTLSALVIAGAGGRIAKHGNRSITSKCGSSDLLEALGVNLDQKPNQVIRSIRKAGIGYFHAPFHHPIFSRMQPLRRAIKIRTLFNLLGPLTNPLKIKAHLLGVSKKGHLDLYAKVLGKIKNQNTLICHSRDGLDEISPNAVTDLVLISKGKQKKLTINPKSFGFRSSQGLRGGNPKQNAQVAKKLLKGQLRSGAAYHAVILNAAAGLWVCGLAKNIREGIRLAEKSIASGRAYRALELLAKFSKN